MEVQDQEKEEQDQESAEMEVRNQLNQKSRQSFVVCHCCPS